jgi:hypothetical protein
MTASSVKAGEAYVVISAKLDQLRSELKKGQGVVRDFGSSFTGVASAISGTFSAVLSSAVVGVLQQSVKIFADVSGQLNDMSVRTGLSATKLQEFSFAAKQSGASLTDVEKALRSMAKHGLNVNDFTVLGERIAAIQDPSERAARAMEVFGKSGTSLLPMFSEFKSLKTASAAVGPLLTEAEVAAGDKLGDATSAMSEALSRAGQSVGSLLAPGLIQVLETCIGITAQLNEWSKKKGNGAIGFGSGVLEAALATAGAPIDMLSNAAFGEKASARGARALASVPGGGDPLANEQEAKRIHQEEEEQLKRIQERVKQINTAFERRNSIIREFENPAERFLRKQEEINRAIAETKAQRDSRMFNTDAANAQLAGLYQALDRLRASFMPKGMEGAADAPGMIAEVMRSARGTFSSAGAALLGRGGASAMERKQDVANRHLANIDRKVGLIGGPAKFS